MIIKRNHKKCNSFLSFFLYLFFLKAGRGPLAGPVVCAAAYIKNDTVLNTLVADSKVMSESDREKSYEVVINSSDVLWGISIVSHTEIDEINILQASLVGMKRACDNLLAKLNTAKKGSNEPSINSKFIALVDGNKLPKDMPVPTVYAIKGDSYIYSISVASIIAKVTRDRIMIEQHTLFPEYNFQQHKGYPTFQHRQTLYEIGPCPIHRSSYAPVKQALIKFADGKGKYMNKTMIMTMTSTGNEVKVEHETAKLSKHRIKKKASVVKKAGNKVKQSVKGSLTSVIEKKQKRTSTKTMLSATKSSRLAIKATSAATVKMVATKKSKSIVAVKKTRTRFKK